MQPYPLTFEPMLLEKVWGGRRLARLGKPLPTPAGYGESWEIADLAQTSASGAGGGARHSVIAHGPMKGRTLHEATAAWGPALIGDAPARDGGFPLLVKYLDAREHLSVQVHPSPAYARAHPGAHLKTESWLVVDAEPGSVIFKGLRPGVSREVFESALRRGQGEGVVELLASVPAVPGECHTLPSGTLHALGAGVLVAEVQTPSDTTFRVYDWSKEYGRAGRALHADEALACADFSPAPAGVRGDAHAGALARTEFYTLREARGHCQEVGLGPAGADPARGRAIIVMLTAGMGAELSARDGSFEGVPMRPGSTVLVPASLAHAAVLRAGPMSHALVVEVGG